MQKIIRWRSVERVKRGDFKGAVQTWRSGFRLARLVGSGELLVQPMVATGMERTIQKGILDAIQEPGCPNLYWALATVPHSQENLQRSMQLEHANLERMFPIFDDTLAWIDDRKYWQSRWRESLQLFASFTRAGDALGITSVSTALGLQCAAVNEQCRKELLAAGLDPKQVADMSVEQIVAIKTQREIREACDQFQAAALLPPHYELATTMDNPIRLMQILQSRGQLISTVILSQLIPGTEQLKRMDYSVTAYHLRLMTIEALRMYAAENNGELPESLEDLKPVPALCDPFTNRLIQYEKTVENGVATSTLELALPTYWDQDRKLKVQIRK